MIYGYITLKQPTVFGEPFAFLKSFFGCLFLGLGSPETSKKRTTNDGFTLHRSFVEPRRQVSKLEGLTAAEEWFEKATMAGVKPNVPWTFDGFEGFDGFRFGVCGSFFGWRCGG